MLSMNQQEVYTEGRTSLIVNDTMAYMYLCCREDGNANAHVNFYIDNPFVLIKVNLYRIIACRNQKATNCLPLDRQNYCKIILNFNPIQDFCIYIR